LGRSCLAEPSQQKLTVLRHHLLLFESDDLQEIALSVLAELRASTGVDHYTQVPETEKPLILVVEDNPEMRQFLSEALAT
jgi:hypothetical protein